MEKDTQQETSLFDERDSSALGVKVEPPYFFGAYLKFQLVGSDPFASEGWIHHCQAMIDQWNSPFYRIKLSVKDIIKRLLRIPVNQSAIAERIRKLLVDKKEISILDVGGGFGDNFFHIERELGPLSKRVSYLVVDNQVQCDFGLKFYENKAKNINFTTKIPKQIFDIVIIIGTIQYIENWKEFVFEVAKNSTDSIFLSRTPINTSGPTFVTVQSICPALGSHALKKVGESNLNVINDSELHQTFKKNGFSVEKSVFIKDYSENFKRLPQIYHNIQYIDKHFVKTNQSSNDHS